MGTMRLGRLSRRSVLRALPGVPISALGPALGGTACAPAGAPTAAAPISLRLLASGTPGRLARVAAWEQRFGAARGASLTVEALPDGGVVDDAVAPSALLAALAAQPRTADLVWLDLVDVPLLAARHALGALDGLVRRDRFDLKRFMPAALQPAYAADERLYGVPAEIDARLIYFNRTHLADAGVDVRRAGLDFREPDMTWESLRHADLDLASSPRVSGRLPFHPGQPGAPLELWGWQCGGEWLAGGGRTATFTRPENVQALDWLAAHTRELSGLALFSAANFPPPARTGTAADEPARHPFVDGRTSICVESTRFVSTIAAHPIRADFGCVELPRRYQGWHLLTMTRAWGYALLAGAPEVAWGALRFLTSEDAATVDAYATAAGQPRAGAASPDVRPEANPEPGRPLWFPPFTGQLEVDKRMADRYRTGSRALDEARDLGLEQLRHGYRRPPTIAPEAVWPRLEEARSAALTERRAALDVLQEAQRAAQEGLDEAWRRL